MDIIKYSAHLWHEKQHHNKHTANQVGTAICTAFVVIILQCWLVFTLNSKNGESLFCGDVIRMVDTDPETPDIMWTEGVSAILERWNEIALKPANYDVTITTIDGFSFDENKNLYTILKIMYLRELAKGWGSEEIAEQ